MKLSTILAAMLDAKADHEIIRRTILDYEAEQLDGLNKRRENDAKRQAEKRKRDDSHVMSRDVTVTVPSHASASPAPDLENKQTNKQENKIDASPSAQPKRGSRIPYDFTPNEEWAVIEGLSPSSAHVEARQFIDYWRSKAGKDALKADWPATWRTWVRNAIKRRNTTGPPRTGVVGAAQRIMEKSSGSESIFGGDSDVKRLSSGGGVERGSAPQDVRSGIGRQFAGSGG